MNTLAFLSATTLMLASASCINGTSITFINSDPNSPLTTKTIQASDIQEIDTSCGIKVIYTQSSKTSVTLKAPKDIIKYIIVEMDGNELKCHKKKNVQINIKRATVTVSAPNVREFNASSGGSITMTKALNIHNQQCELSASSGALINLVDINCGNLEADASSGAAIKLNSASVKTDFEADATSGSDIKINQISANSVDADASSGAEIALSGKCTSVSFEASSGASINASKLTAQNGTATTSSGGSVSCNVKKSLNKNKHRSGGSIKNTAY